MYLIIYEIKYKIGEKGYTHIVKFGLTFCDFLKSVPLLNYS